MARTIPAFFRAIPLNNATKMWANRRHLGDLAVSITVAGNLLHPAAKHGAAARLNLAGGFYFARRYPIKILLRYVKVFLGKNAGSANGFSRRTVQRFPWVLLTDNK